LQLGRPRHPLIAAQRRRIGHAEQFAERAPEPVLVGNRQRQQTAIGAAEDAVGRLGADVSQRLAVHHRAQHH
jgi:hypothetical protein